jgi:hypothetical protein
MLKLIEISQQFLKYLIPFLKSIFYGATALLVGQDLLISRLHDHTQTHYTR